MSLTERVHQDMVQAMKSREEQRLSTLRMMKSALKNKEIEKRSPLTDAEAGQVLLTMVKQRQDSIEQFTKGNRPELAAQEAAEIPIIESYMPRAASEDDLRRIVGETLQEMTAAGPAPTAKEMGKVMKEVQARLQITGMRADGKLLSELVRTALA